MGQTIETYGDLAAKWDAHILYWDGSGFEEHVGPAAVVPRCRAARRYLGQGVMTVVSGPSQWRWRFCGCICTRIRRLQNPGGRPGSDTGHSQPRPLGSPLHSEGDHPVDELTPRQRGTVAVRWVPGHAGVQGGEITDKAAKEGKMPSAGPANPGDGTEAAVDARSPLRGPSHAPPGSSPAEGERPETEEHVRESRLSPLAC
jgi:hypothetical protein